MNQSPIVIDNDSDSPRIHTPSPTLSPSTTPIAFSKPSY